MLTFLVGCGGGATTSDGGGGSVPVNQPSNNPNYVALAANSGGTSQISGAALSTNSSNGNVTVGGFSGNLQHWNGNLTINNGIITFSADQDGFDPNGVTQGTDGKTLLVDDVLGAGYNYLTVFQIFGDASSGTQDLIGIMGVPTKPNHMPNAGSMTYDGSAQAIVVTQADGTVLLMDGDATLSVNFNSGQGTLVMSQFSPQTAAGTTFSNSPVQSIQIVSMDVIGTALSGGTLMINGNLPAGHILGENVQLDSQGQFFGLDGNMPSEVGGVIHAQGSDGVLSAVYVAN